LRWWEGEEEMLKRLIYFVLGCFVWAYILAYAAYRCFPGSKLSFIAILSIAFGYFFVCGGTMVCRFSDEPLADIPASRFVFYPLLGFLIVIILAGIRFTVRQFI
jgi:hypothetical protein